MKPIILPYGNIERNYDETHSPADRPACQESAQDIWRDTKGLSSDFRHRAAVYYRVGAGQTHLPDRQGSDRPAYAWHHDAIDLTRRRGRPGKGQAMKRKLDVYLHRHLVGNLVQDEHGQITFDYAETWLKHPAAIALSHSLPLTKKHFNRNECRGFFAGVLPEESKREIVAKNLGISAKN